MSSTNTEELDGEILKEAKKRYQQAVDYWAEHQARTTTLLKFVAGDQWSEEARQAFENNGYQATTVNVLPSYIRQIVNELKGKIPQIEFNPMDDTSKDAAEIYTDLVRNIQIDSSAEIAYDTAVRCAVETGVGYFRITSDYEDPEAFDQRIVIEPIEDPNSVLPDPSHRSITMDDAGWVMIRTAMSKEEYKSKYPRSGLTALDEDPRGWTENLGVLLSKDEVIVLEYYVRDWMPATLYRTLNRNSGVIEDTTEPDFEGINDGTLTVLKTRETKIPVVQHYILNEVEVLAATTFPGGIIPVVAVKGNEAWIQSKRRLSGAIEPAVDSQVMLNAFHALQAQLVQMAPKAPYIGTAKQFQSFEQLWADANVSGQAFLPYNADPAAAGPPVRDLGEVPIQSMATLCNETRENMKQIFGIYDASLGNRSNETSGVAILARQDQSSNSNYHFFENLKRSLVSAGRILLAAIPVFYDAERTIQTSQPDGTLTAVQVNGPNQPDLTVGNFSVAISTGPSFGTKRQESVTTMLELGRIYPSAMPVISDIIAANMDFPNAALIADRLRTQVPPDALAATSNSVEDAETLVPMLKTQVSQAQKELQALNQHAMQVEQELKITKQTLQLEKMDKAVEVSKNDQTYQVKAAELDLSRRQTEAEIQLETAKLALEERKLALQEKQLEINAVIAASNIAGEVHDRTVTHLERKPVGSVSVVSPVENDLDGIGADQIGGDISRNGI